MITARGMVCWYSIVTMAIVIVIAPPSIVLSLAPASPKTVSRRDAVAFVAAAATAASGIVVAPKNAVWAAADEGGGVNVDDFLRSGMVAQPMGVSGQAGKSKPTTGVVLREGSTLARNAKTGDVLAEILVTQSSKKDYLPVVVSFTSPWPLATGPLYDVECRSSDTGDGAFLAVSKNVGSLSDVNKAFVDQTLFSPTGRFSFYGQPTDIKVKEQASSDESASYKRFEVSFATLSQSTQTEIPRKAIVTATIPNGSSQAVLLVASASALRWKKSGANVDASKVMDSFRAIPAPTTGLAVRPQTRRDEFE